MPASPRIAPLFRQLYDGVKASSLSEEFEVTLEATHHGPWHGAGTPCCFVEIGSKVSPFFFTGVDEIDSIVQQINQNKIPRPSLPDFFS